MKYICLLSALFVGSHALINDVAEDCIITSPISNTIVTAGKEMKISWANSHINEFSSIYLVQADGKYPDRPIEIATDVPADAGTIMVDLPKYLAPSNAYYMTLGQAPNHCRSGNLRIMASDSYVPGQEPPVTIGRHPEKPKTEQTGSGNTIHTTSSSSSTSSSSTMSPSSLALMMSILFGISYCL